MKKSAYAWLSFKLKIIGSSKYLRLPRTTAENFLQDAQGKDNFVNGSEMRIGTGRGVRLEMDHNLIYFDGICFELFFFIFIPVSPGELSLHKL